MKCFALILLLMCVIFPAALQAAGSSAALSGRVIERGTNLPVAGAAVAMQGTSFRTHTDAAGHYRLAPVPPGVYDVSVRRVGYAPLYQQVDVGEGEERPVDFQLQSISYPLDPVTTTATRVQSKASEVSTSVAVISASDLEHMAVRDVADAVERVPGVFINPYGALGDVRTVSIRGSTAGQVLVLLDGQRLNTPQSGEVDLSAIPAEGIERIEVIRGGASAMYGADAVGGVVNIITATDDDRRGLSAGARVIGGSFGTRGVEVNADQTAEQTASSLSYRYLGSDGDFPYHPLPSVTALRNNADFFSHTLFGKERWNITPQSVLTFTGHYLASNTGDPGTVYSPSSTARKRHRDMVLDLALDHEFEGVLRTLRAQSDFQNLIFNYDDPYAYVPVRSNTHALAVNGEIQSGFQFGEWNALTAGYAYRLDDLSGNSLLTDKRRNLHSLYVLEEISWRHIVPGVIDRVALIPALRWDRFSDFGAQLSPKIGVVVNAGDRWLVTLKSNFGKSFRAPTFNDLYWPRDNFAVGNSTLRPERATDFDAGISLEAPVMAGAMGSATWFHNSITDMILWEPGAGGIWSPQNVGMAEIKGIEASLSFSPWRDLLTVGWNYTYLDAQNESGNFNEIGKQLPYRPRHLHKFTARTRWHGFYGGADMVSSGLRYTTASNTTFLDAYRAVDLLAGYAWNAFGGSMAIKIDVKNLEDADYQVLDGYPVPGREYRVSLSFTTSPLHP